MDTSALGTSGSLKRIRSLPGPQECSRQSHTPKHRDTDCELSSTPRSRLRDFHVHAAAAPNSNRRGSGSLIAGDMGSIGKVGPRCCTPSEGCRSKCKRKRAMKSRRLTIGIFATLSIMLIAMLVLIERGGSSNFARNASIVTFIVSAVPLGLFVALRIRLRR